MKRTTSKVPRFLLNYKFCWIWQIIFKGKVQFNPYTFLLGTTAWRIDCKVESVALKCAPWNQAMNKMLAVILTDFLALVSSGDANVEWVEDGDWSYHSSALSHKRSWWICRRAAWIHKVGNRVRHRFELVEMECRSVAVTLNTSLRWPVIAFMCRIS